MRKYIVGIVIFLVGLGIGVGLTKYSDLNQVSSTQFLIPMKVYHQETYYSCGGAVIKTLLDYYNMLGDRSEKQLNEALNTGLSEDDPGTHPDDMVNLLKNENLEVISGENGNMELIYHYLNQNVPVVVLDSTWGAHWRIVIGYDFNGDYNNWKNNDLFFADPWYHISECIVDPKNNTITENESRFVYEWYENRLFEKQREKYYIIAFPKTWEVKQFDGGNIKNG